MSTQAKPDTNEVWASSGTIIDPGTAKVLLGYIQEKPEFETMNYILNLFAEMVQHVNLQGIPEWDSTTEYEIAALVKGSDGLVYYGLTATNQGNDPTSSPSDWRESVGVTDNHRLALVNALSTPTSSNPVVTADDRSRLIVQDRRTANTAAQSLTGSTLNTRTLNTIQYKGDWFSGVTIDGGDQIIQDVPDGTYYVSCSAKMDPNANKPNGYLEIGIDGGAALAHDTFASNVSTSEYAQVAKWAFEDYITLSGGPTDLVLRHYVSAAADGGAPVNLSSKDEIYAQVMLVRMPAGV